MHVAELATTVRDAITVSRVFAEPYEKDGVTVIAAATVPSGARAPWIDLPEVQSTRSRIWCSETLLGSGSEVLPDTESGDNRPKLRPQCDQATRDRWGQMPDSGRRHGRWPGPTGTGDG